MMRRIRVPSASVGSIDALVRVPSGPPPPDGFPLVLLLHGRGGDADGWVDAVDTIAREEDAGALPPAVLLAPDAPWSQRAGYWIDSAFTGSDDVDPGRAIDTAVMRDLLPEVERRIPISARRERRMVAGASMGGAGALSVGLRHAPTFGAITALSPATYPDLPPSDSSTRWSGAFGEGEVVFSDERYRELGIRRALAGHDPALPLELVLANGADEPPHPPEESGADAGAVTAELHRMAASTPGIRSRREVYRGGHDFCTWTPALLDALARFAGTVTR